MPILPDYSRGLGLLIAKNESVKKKPHWIAQVRLDKAIERVGYPARLND
jgi:hypothetical protein